MYDDDCKGNIHDRVSRRTRDSICPAGGLLSPAASVAHTLSHLSFLSLNRSHVSRSNSPHVQNPPNVMSCRVPVWTWFAFYICFRAIIIMMWFFFFAPLSSFLSWVWHSTLWEAWGKSSLSVGVRPEITPDEEKKQKRKTSCKKNSNSGRKKRQTLLDPFKAIISVSTNFC